MRGRRLRGLLGGALLLAGLVCAFAGVSVWLGDDLLGTAAVGAAVAPTAWTPSVAPSETPVFTPEPTARQPDATAAVQAPAETALVWIPASGTRYHATDTCSGMQSPTQATVLDAVASGLVACQRCNPPAP